MITSKEVAGPLVDARDVLESFRTYGLVVDGWQESLRASAQRLVNSVDESAEESSIRNLSNDLEVVAKEGLVGNRAAVQRAADLLALLVAQVAVPGIPRPDDEDWTFG